VISEARLRACAASAWEYDPGSSARAVVVLTPNRGISVTSRKPGLTEKWRQRSPPGIIPETVNPPNTAGDALSG